MKTVQVGGRWPSKIRTAFVKRWGYTQRRDTELYQAIHGFPDSDLPESAPRDPGAPMGAL